MRRFLNNLRASLNTVRPSRILNDVSRAPTGHRAALFRSARVKLTGFYLIVLLVLSLTLTLSLRWLASSAFDRAGAGDRGAVRQLFEQYYSVPVQPNGFNHFENMQSATVHQNLNRDVILINLAALVLGGLLSYWYAGRTLKPIEAAHETQARFAADASHELRTPLTSMKVENEVFLHQRNFSKPEARDLIQSNLEEVQRLENLATNLLALAQYEQQPLQRVPVSIAAIIDTAIEQAAKNAAAQKISFSLHVVPRQVVGHFDSLVELVGIVLDNALKYSPVGSRVLIEGVIADGRYHVSVRDAGPGIADADLPHIFERLYRGDKARTGAAAGYGLGLSLAQEIVRANRGTISARNYPDGGAQFVISLGLAKS